MLSLPALTHPRRAGRARRIGALLAVVASVAMAAAAATACGPSTLRTGRTFVPLDPATPRGDRVPLYWELHRPRATAEGPPVLVFHGGPGAPERDVRAQPFWRDIVTAVPVVYFDQRGAGRSGRLEDGRCDDGGVPGRCWAAPADEAEAYRLARLADDAAAVRRNALGADGPVVALGVSSGAQVALLYALRHPAEVRALILVEPAPDHRWVSAARSHLAAFLERLAEGHPDRAAGLARLRAQVDDARAQVDDARAEDDDKPAACEGLTPDGLLFGVVGRSAYTRAAQRRLGDALAALGRGDPKPLCGLARARSAAPGPLDTPLRSEALFRTVACAELGWSAVSPANCVGVAPAERLDLGPRLPRIDVPTLILSSTHDPIVPPALHAAVARGLGGPVTVVRLDESGHLVLQEQPEAARDAVLAFLRGL